MAAKKKKIIIIITTCIIVAALVIVLCVTYLNGNSNTEFDGTLVKSNIELRVL